MDEVPAVAERTDHGPPAAFSKMSLKEIYSKACDGSGETVPQGKTLALHTADQGPGFDPIWSPRAHQK